VGWRGARVNVGCCVCVNRVMQQTVGAVGPVRSVFLTRSKMGRCQWCLTRDGFTFSVGLGAGFLIGGCPGSMVGVVRDVMILKVSCLCKVSEESIGRLFHVALSALHKF